MISREGSGSAYLVPQISSSRTECGISVRNGADKDRSSAEGAMLSSVPALPADKLASAGNIHIFPCI